MKQKYSVHGTNHIYGENNNLGRDTNQDYTSNKNLVRETNYGKKRWNKNIASTEEIMSMEGTKI
jgi:YD repeat-containing protein